MCNHYIVALYIIILEQPPGPIPVVYIDTTGTGRVVSNLNNQASHEQNSSLCVYYVWIYSNMNNQYRSHVSSKIVVCCTSFRLISLLYHVSSKPFDRHSVTGRVSVNSEMTPFKFSSSYRSSQSLYIVLLEQAPGAIPGV